MNGKRIPTRQLKLLVLAKFSITATVSSATSITTATTAPICADLAMTISATTLAPSLETRCALMDGVENTALKVPCLVLFVQLLLYSLALA